MHWDRLLVSVVCDFSCLECLNRYDMAVKVDLITHIGKASLVELSIRCKHWWDVGACIRMSKCTCLCCTPSRLSVSAIRWHVSQGGIHSDSMDGLFTLLLKLKYFIVPIQRRISSALHCKWNQQRDILTILPCLELFRLLSSKQHNKATNCVFWHVGLCSEKRRNRVSQQTALPYCCISPPPPQWLFFLLKQIFDCFKDAQKSCLTLFVISPNTLFE